MAINMGYHNREKFVENERLWSTKPYMWIHQTPSPKAQETERL